MRPDLGPKATAEKKGTMGYGDVQALQLGPEGHTLAVLLGDGTLDGWDLVTGTRLGHWRLGRPYTAMCHDGHHLLLARRGEEGPAIDIAALPGVLATRPVEGRGGLWHSEQDDGMISTL